MLNQLKNIGLSDNEAKVYMAMLELGPATMLEISAKAGINRPTAYAQLESLKKRGLVSTQAKGKKSLFAAEPPSQLESMLEREGKEVELKQEELNRVLPELSTMFNLGGEKPSVRFFEGKEGLMKMQDEFLKSKVENIISVASLDDILNVFPNLLSTYSSRRAQKRIPSKVLYTSSKGPILPAHDPESMRETKFIDPSKLPFSSDVAVYGDSIVISSLKGTPSAAVITHKQMADSFRALLELLWLAADKI